LHPGSKPADRRDTQVVHMRLASVQMNGRTKNV
jgi:hypothetical protein